MTRRKPTESRPVRHADDAERSAREACQLLGLGDDPSRLCPADRLRCDLVATLRIAIDHAGATAMEGGSADVGRLVSAVEQLTRLLPKAATEAPSHREDPRAALLKLILEQRARAGIPNSGVDERDAELAALRAENLQLRTVARAAGLPVAPPALKPDTRVAFASPPEADITPPSEIGEFYVGGPRPGPDDPKPRTPRVIEHEATAAPAAKASPSLDDVTAAYSKPEEPWRSHLNRNFDPWADNR